MSDELKAFRSELATPSHFAAARGRRRLHAAIAAERGERRPRRTLGRPAAVAAACVLCVAAFVTASAGLLGGGENRVTQAGRPAPDAARTFAPRAGLPDGRLAFAPPEGKDAGMRPRFEQGGWSECGINGCYLQL